MFARREEPLALLWRRRDISENDHDHSAQCLWTRHRLDGDIDDLGVSAASYFHILKSYDDFLSNCLVKSFAQRAGQAFASHGKDVPVRLACGRLQIFPVLPLTYKISPSTVTRTAAGE